MAPTVRVSARCVNVRADPVCAQCRNQPDIVAVSCGDVLPLLPIIAIERDPREDSIMADIDLVKHDQGGVNARILAKESKADFRRVEAASLKIKTSFASAEGKRLFIRYFNTFQLGNHFISVISRTRLDHEEVAKAEAAIRAQMERIAEELNRAIDGAEALFQANGVTRVATYDTLPLEVEVGVLSSSSRRYLEILNKLDRLMPLLQTLEIHEVITTQAVDIERAAFKRKVRDVANGARNVATRLRREMNALDARRAGGDAGARLMEGGASSAAAEVVAVEALAAASSLSERPEDVGSQERPEDSHPQAIAEP